MSRLLLFHLTVRARHSRFVYFYFFSKGPWKLPLLFPVREWNYWWNYETKDCMKLKSLIIWNYGIDSRIETFRFQHWKKFRKVNVQLQTNVELWLNEKLIDFSNATIFQENKLKIDRFFSWFFRETDFKI